MPVRTDLLSNRVRHASQRCSTTRGHTEPYPASEILAIWVKCSWSLENSGA